MLWRSLSDVPAAWGPSAVALGVFDGVHLGHQALLKETVAVAAARSLTPAVVSFDHIRSRSCDPSEPHVC